MAEQRRQEFRVETLHEPVSHYTDAVRWGDLLFVSGVAPFDKEGRLVSDDVVVQARKVFENMKEILDAAGGTVLDVVKGAGFLTQVGGRPPLKPIRPGKIWAGGPPPP